MYVGQVTNGDVGVDLGRVDALLAEHRLDVAQIGTGAEHVRGEAVAERVRGDVLVDVRSLDDRRDGLRHAGFAEPFARQLFIARSS